MTDERAKFGSIKDIPDSVWEKLSKKKIYFGHMSVGYNIIDGIEDIMREHPEIKLNIVESTDPEIMKSGTFAHSKVGENTKPKTKIDAFAEFLNSGIGEKANVAALKLCYVDIRADAEPEKLFSTYEDEMDNIRKTYPDLTLIHFTSPLTTLQTGPKAWIKKIIGRPVYGKEENVNRYKYNEFLRARYHGKEPILDIAKIESTLPDGSRLSYLKNGKTYYAMVPEYTTDGGHLNKVGRKKVAEQLLILLANLS